MSLLTSFLQTTSHTKVRNAVYNYHKVISEYMKDSLHVNQLVGIDMGPNTGDDRTFDYKSLTLSTIDVVGVNLYYSAPNALYISDNNYVYSNLVKTIWGNHGFIPVLISGGGNSKYGCSNYSQFAVDAMTVPFCGVAGYNQWEGWDPGQENLRDITIRAQDHMNGNDVIKTLNNEWSWSRQAAEHEKIKKYSVEHQYYISDNLNRAVGYVYNRRYNAITRAVDVECSFVTDGRYKKPRNVAWNDVKNNERIRIDGLKKKTTYNIYWYSAFQIQNNGYIKYNCMETDKKVGRWGITLKYPNLTSTWHDNGNGDVPTVWYVIRKGNCNPGMTPQPNATNEQINIQNKIKVYPNPFDDSFTIISKKKDNLILKSIDGKNIGTFAIKEGVNRIVTSRLSEGIYLGTLVNQNINFKIIKQ